ncbi:MAG: hypothetical protein R3F41_03465 [Gammaproteobacteria bacterium]|nr:hypothetical protein [Pseudomonadales bacterium]MCP5345650.1 hypothetical protein [Pseudomonadales bacterium]
MRSRFVNAVLLTWILLVTTGCGFSLRGSDTLSGNLPRLQLYLQEPGGEMARLLREALEGANVAIQEIEPDTLDSSVPVLVVGAEQMRSRPITVTPRARAAQYDIRLVLPVQLLLGENRLLGPEDLSIQQVYYENTGNITGTIEEREIIQSELRRELVNQLLRRLEAAAAGNIVS